MATLTVQDVPVAGLADVVWTPASSGGDEAPVGGGLVLLVANDDTTSHTLTVATPATVRGLALEDTTVAVAAGGTAAVPLSSLYRDPATGRAGLSLDAETGVSYAVLRVPR